MVSNGSNAVVGEVSKAQGAEPVHYFDPLTGARLTDRNAMIAEYSGQALEVFRVGAPSLSDSATAMPHAPSSSSVAALARLTGKPPAQLAATYAFDPNKELNAAQLHRVLVDHHLGDGSRAWLPTTAAADRYLDGLQDGTHLIVSVVGIDRNSGLATRSVFGAERSNGRTLFVDWQRNSVTPWLPGPMRTNIGWLSHVELTPLTHLGQFAPQVYRGADAASGAAFHAEPSRGTGRDFASERNGYLLNGNTLRTEDKRRMLRMPTESEAQLSAAWAHLVASAATASTERAGSVRSMRSSATGSSAGAHIQAHVEEHDQASVHSGRSSRRELLGSLNYVLHANENDPVGINAERVLPDPRFQDVVVHGGRDAVEVSLGEHLPIAQITAGEFATLVEQNPAFEARKPVRLLSCGTGDPAGTFAQRLANELGVRVRAPSWSLVVTESGHLAFPLHETAQFFDFEPSSNVRDNRHGIPVPASDWQNQNRFVIANDTSHSEDAPPRPSTPSDDGWSDDDHSLAESDTSRPPTPRPRLRVMNADVSDSDSESEDGHSAEPAMPAPAPASPTRSATASPVTAAPAVLPTTVTAPATQADTEFGRFLDSHFDLGFSPDLSLHVVDAEAVSTGTAWFRRSRTDSRGAIGARATGTSEVRADQVNTGAQMSGDNCVLCTAGGSARPRLTSTAAAANANVNEGGLLVGQQVQTLTANDLGDGRAGAFTDWTAAGRFMRDMPRGTRFAVSYRHEGSIGHTIAAERGRWLGRVRYRDYQSNEARHQPDAHMNAAVAILVFPLNHLPGVDAGQMILNAGSLTPEQRSVVSRSFANDGNRISGWKLLQDRMADGAARGRRLLEQRSLPAGAQPSTALELDAASSLGGAVPTPRSSRSSSPTRSLDSIPPYHPASGHEGTLASLARPMRMDPEAFHYRAASSCGK